MSAPNGSSLLQKVYGASTEPSFLREVPLGNTQAARNKRLVMGAHTNANFKVNSNGKSTLIGPSLVNGRPGAAARTAVREKIAAAKGGKRTRKYRKKMNKRKTRSYRK
jgi:hypothetical protein